MLCFPSGTDLKIVSCQHVWQAGSPSNRTFSRLVDGVWASPGFLVISQAFRRTCSASGRSVKHGDIQGFGVLGVTGCITRHAFIQPSVLPTPARHP